MAFYPTLNGLKTDDPAAWSNLLEKLRKQRRTIKPASENLMFTVLVDRQPPKDDTSRLSRTLASLLDQSFYNFETIICGGASDITTIKDSFRKFRGIFTVPDRLDHILRHPEQSAQLRGDFLLFISAGTTVEPDCLLALNDKITQASRDTPIDIATFDYCVEDQKTVAFLPGWDPDFLHSWDYLQGAAAISNSLVPSMPILSAGASARAVVASLAVLPRSFATCHIASPLLTLEPDHTDHAPKTLEPFRDRDGVSIIIPTRNNIPMLEKCLGFLDKELPFDVDLVLIDNASDPAQVDTYYAHIRERFGARIVPMNQEFNYSRMINLGVQASVHPNLLFLNNDVTFLDHTCIATALQQIKRPEIGVIGSLLLYPDMRVQHGGMKLLLNGPDKEPSAQHLLRMAPSDGDSYLNMVRSPLNCQAVTGAFQMVRRSVFDAVDGYDEVSLPIEYNDVDFCLKVRDLGLRVVNLPLDGVIHNESATRGHGDTPRTLRLRIEAQQIMWARWPAQFTQDPFDNPNVKLGETATARLLGAI